MKKLNKIMLALSILPTLLTSVFLFFMNDTVPMHYNASGAVDRYGSKYENFILPAIILCMYAFYMVYTKIYTKYSTNSVEKINNNVKITAILVTSIIAAFNILQLMFLILAILKPDSTTFTDNVPFIINTVMGLMLIIVFINSYVGNHSGNFKLGFDVYGTDMIIMNIFLLITVVCAVMSIILKSIK